MTYNIVEVAPGKYAIRRRTFFEELFNLDGKFLDIINGHGIYWWPAEDYFFPCCVTTDADSLVPKLEFYRAKKHMKVIL